MHPNIFNISRPLEKVCAPVSTTARMRCVRRLVFSLKVRPNLMCDSAINDISIFRDGCGSVGLHWNFPLLHMRCGIADTSRIRSQDSWFSFLLLLRMTDWCSVEVLVDPVQDSFTCLRHTFSISPQLKQHSLAAGQFSRPLSLLGWDISLHPSHGLSLKILGVPSPWDRFCSDLTEPNIVGGTRLFRRWVDRFICGFQANQPVEFLFQCSKNISFS